MTKAHIAVIAAVISSALAQNSGRPAGSDRARLIGAWHLVSIAGPDGKPVSAVPKGMLIYTGDGHMSVQLMYPASASAVSNKYVRNGYEASFGSYDINQSRHMVTHHVEGANTGDLLVGKDLPRIYQFTENGRMTIRSARADEHWSVTWEHY
ncbi:MAG: lipocalin-like domain-containing protein [Acidobacteriaceae bacterium]|nr:lipocalin-like domain-containing protein [Acidobacteriaceae bacterium]MBV8571590.1 lipocalin-like domain-containing protein [Acidobacteriaceae bacterium]